MSLSDQIEKDTRRSINSLLSCVENGKNGVASLIDPIEGKRIAAHYGETHLCAALMLRAQRDHDIELWNQFRVLFDGVLTNWDKDTKLSTYHADFNNFAIALIYNKIKDNEQLRSRIIDKLLQSQDSRNLTINWLPMRAYVNLTRYIYTKESKYLDVAQDCFAKTLKACYLDGMIDDLLPKGESFNLQYCISTIATVLLIKNDFEAIYSKLPKIEIENTVSKLINCILPDGDVNYMGRGCNQLFAWGPWLYLIDKIDDPEVQYSYEYLKKWYHVTLSNNNLLLNDYNGADQILWWDYHYYSVYAAHFLLWYELAKINDKGFSLVDNKINYNDSGFSIIKTADFAVVSFSGRKHYLIERGPAIVALWSNKHGSLYKCGHAPTREAFGTLHFNPISAVMNHFGLVEVDGKKSMNDNKILRKIRRKMSIYPHYKQEFKPVFALSRIEEMNNGEISIEFETKGKSDKLFILPIFNCNAISNFELYVNNEKCKFSFLCMTESQYGDCYVYSSPIRKSEKWVLHYIF